MMSALGISTLSMSNALRVPAGRVQAELARAQAELASGRHADVGLALGGRTGDASTLHGVRTRLDAFSDSNTLASARLSATGAVLSDVLGTAKSLQVQVIAALGGTASARTVANDAQSALSSTLAGLNTSIAGQHLFAGINTDVKPFADNGARGAQGVSDAFAAAFGFPPGDGAASSITPAAMRDFLNGAFAEQFTSSAWQSNWSDASPAAITSRISPTQVAATSVIANDPALRGTVEVGAMLSQLGLQSLSADTRAVVLAKASELLGEAVGDIADLQARVGTMGNTVSAASDGLARTKTFIDTQIGALEDVDPAEVSTRIARLTAQLESAYALTGKLAQLSLVHYLP